MKNLAITCIGLLVSFQVHAQSINEDRWSAVFSPVITMSTQDLNEGLTNTGFGFETFVSYKLTQGLHSYLGYEWYRFTFDPLATKTNDGYHESGFSFGAFYLNGMNGFPTLRLKAGGILNHLEIDEGNEEFVSDAGLKLGWEIGFGIQIPGGDRWKLFPEIKHRSVSRHHNFQKNSYASLKLVEARNLSSTIFFQHTIMGLQRGYSLRYQSKKRFGLGLLFQSNLNPSGEDREDYYPFYGFQLLVPIIKFNEAQFIFSPKIGFVNENFFVLIPEVETDIRVSNGLSVGITSGIRARKSSVGLILIIDLL